jgi:hypothetical protein
MGLKQCDKCDEMVDEAKAFCPGCGNSLLAEETRKEASNFDSFAGTVQLGNTMYNQMLSNMGLNISEAPNAHEKRVEVIAPVEAAAEPPENVVEKPKPSYTKWIILGGVVVIALFLLFVVAAVLIFVYISRFS